MWALRGLDRNTLNFIYCMYNENNAIMDPFIRDIFHAFFVQAGDKELTFNIIVAIIIINGMVLLS